MHERKRCRTAQANTHLKGDAICQAGESAEARQTSEASESSAAFKELQKWVDTTDAQYAVLHAKHEAIAGRFATAIR